MCFETVLGSSTSSSIKDPSIQGRSQCSADIALTMAQTFLCSEMWVGTGFDNLVQSTVKTGSPARNIIIPADIPRQLFTGIVILAQTTVQKIIRPQTLQGNFYYSICSNSSRYRVISIMAPRVGHKVPRRGGHSSQTSDTRRSQLPRPKRIPPLACASPPSGASPPSNASTPLEDLDNTVQIATFRYRRRTNKPVVKARITVIFDEEDEEEESCTNDSGKKTPTPSENSSKAKDNSYNPEIQSRIEEESTEDYLAEQEEAAKELNSLKRKEPMDSTEGILQAHMDPHGSKLTPTQSGLKNEEEEDSLDYALYLKLPPGYDSIEDVPEGVEVTWEPDPIQAAEARKKRAMDREAEAKNSKGK